MPFIENSGGGGGGGSGTVTQVSSANAAIAVATGTTTPVLTAGTLDVIATAGPPAAAVAMNAKKITGLANGSAATDAAAFGQIPALVDSATKTTNTAISATTEGTANAIITGAGFTADGTSQYMVEFFCCEAIASASANAYLVFVLLDGATVVVGKWGVIGGVPGGTGGPESSLLLRYLTTPTAASHTFNVAAFRIAGNGSVQGGAGGTGADGPVLLTVTQLRH